MNEYDEDVLEDCKPFTENRPNNTTDNNTPSPQMRDLSYIQNTEKRFDKGYDSDSEDGPFVPEQIPVETVQEDDDIVPTLTVPPVAPTVMFPDTPTDTTKTTPSDDDNPDGVFVNIDVVDIIKMKNSTLKNELYLCKEKNSGNKADLVKQLTIAMVNKKPKFTDNQIRVAKGKKKAPEINPSSNVQSLPIDTKSSN